MLPALSSRPVEATRRRTKFQLDIEVEPPLNSSGSEALDPAAVLQSDGHNAGCESTISGKAGGMKE